MLSLSGGGSPGMRNGNPPVRCGTDAATAAPPSLLGLSDPGSRQPSGPGLVSVTSVTYSLVKLAPCVGTCQALISAPAGPRPGPPRPGRSSVSARRGWAPGHRSDGSIGDVIGGPDPACGCTNRHPRCHRDMRHEERGDLGWAVRTGVWEATPDGRGLPAWLVRSSLTAAVRVTGRILTGRARSPCRPLSCHSAGGSGGRDAHARPGG